VPGAGGRRCIEDYLWLDACRWAHVAFIVAVCAALALARPLPQPIRRHSEDSSSKPNVFVGFPRSETDPD
jgi:hypothetical protein